MESAKQEDQAQRAGPAPREAPGAAMGTQTPTLPLPRGAIRGIGEKFAADPVAGSGSKSVPSTGVRAALPIVLDTHPLSLSRVGLPALSIGENSFVPFYALLRMRPDAPSGIHRDRKAESPSLGLSHE
jgi:hypothetical protein